MLIDVRTAYLLLGLLYIVLPVTVFFLLRHNNLISIKFWCGGGLVAGIGMVFLGIRPFLEAKFPGFITYTLGNTLIMIGYTMRTQSLRIDLQKPISRKVLISSIILFIGFFELARSDYGSIAARMILAYFWSGTLIYLLAKSAYDYEKKFEIKQIRFIWVSYLVLALALLIRSFLLLVGLEEARPFENSISNGLIVLLGIIGVIYSNVAYVGVMLGRAEKTSVLASQKNAKLLDVLNKQTNVIKDLMRVQAFSVVGTYGATIVHEVLQPLTAMRFALENLKIHLLKNGEDKTTQDRIDAVDVSASRAISVIENLRNFIVEREVQIEAVSFNKMIQEVLEIISSRAKALDVDVCLQLSDQILVMADEHQLQRVLFNIVNNALDAVERNISSEDRRILIDAKYVQQRQFALIKVVDSGAGLQDKNQLEIFEWLSANSQKGMGIGLALSKILVESWRGHIAAYNADPKVDGLSGAVFELKLQSA